MLAIKLSHNTKEKLYVIQRSKICGQGADGLMFWTPDKAHSITTPREQ